MKKNECRKSRASVPLNSYFRDFLLDLDSRPRLIFRILAIIEYVPLGTITNLFLHIYRIKSFKIESTVI